MIALLALLAAAPALAQDANERQGFVAHMALGVGSFADNFETDAGFFVFQGSAVGASAAFALAGGVALNARWTFGGMLTVDSVADPTVEIEGIVAGGIGVGALTLLGPYAELHLWPKGGWFFTGALGAARMQIRDQDGGVSNHEPVGGGLILGAAREWTLNERFGVGAQIRATFASMSAEDTTHGARALSLLVVGTYD